MGEDYERMLRDGYDAFNRGDFEAAIKNFSPEFEWHRASDAPSSDPSDLDGLRTLMEPDAFDRQRLTVDRVDIRGEHVLVSLTTRNRGALSGVEIEGPIFHLWQFENGKPRRCRSLSNQDEAQQVLESI